MVYDRRMMGFPFLFRCTTCNELKPTLNDDIYDCGCVCHFDEISSSINRTGVLKYHA